MGEKKKKEILAALGRGVSFLVVKGKTRKCGKKCREV